jgi:hypothetical protein
MHISEEKWEICAKMGPISLPYGHFRQKITLQAGGFAPNARA